MKIKSVTIIGSGISGISAAIYAQKNGYQVTVIEQSDSPGGIIDTFSDNNIFFEFGAHSLYNSYINLLALIEEARLKHLLTQKEKLPFLMYENGKIYTVLKKINKIRVGFGIIAWYLFSREKYSVSGYYTKIMGKYNYNYVLRHCFNAVLSQDAKNFPAGLLFKIKQRNKSFPRQYAIQGGLSVLIRRLVTYYKINIDFNCNVTKIKKNDTSGYTLETNLGDFQADKLILATPVHVASSLLSNVKPAASKILNQIGVSKIVSCGVVFKGKSSKLPRLAGLIGVDEDFYSLVSSDPSSSDAKHRAVVIHFKYKHNLDEQKYINKACSILNIIETDIMSFKLKYQTVPMLCQGHDLKIKLLDSCLDKSNIQLTGNYFKRLAIEDCITRSKHIVSLL